MGLEGLEGLMIVETTTRENFRLDFGERLRRFVVGLGTLRMLAWDLGICMRGLSMVQKVDG